MLACSVGNGAVVSVDFQGAGAATVSGGGVLGGGSLWNVAGEGYGVEVPLQDAAGASSGLRVWTEGFTGTRLEGDALYGDYLVGDVELRGLQADTAYELVVFTAANIQQAFFFPGSWTPTGASASPPDFCAYGDPALPGMEGCDYLRGIAVADNDGVIAIGAGFGAIAGLQLDISAPVNPEPSVAFLQAIAFVALVFRRRRR